MGACIDILYYSFRNFRPTILFFVLTGAIAYTMIPIGRIILHLLSLYPYQSIIKAGIPYTVFSHLLFGAAGALLAAGLIFSAGKIKK